MVQRFRMIYWTQLDCKFCKDILKPSINLAKLMKKDRNVAKVMAYMRSNEQDWSVNFTFVGCNHL